MKKYKIEIVKFFKDNLVKILAGILLLTILYVGLSYKNSKVGIDVNLDKNEKLNNSSEPIEFHVDKNEANFYFYIENDNGTSFTNHYLIEQYITSPKILQKASASTNTKIDKIVVETENRTIASYNETGETKVIGVKRNDTTGMFEFHVNINNEDANLRIANYFYEYVVNKEIPLLEKKSIYLYQEPKMKEVSQVSVFDDETELDKIEEYNIFKAITIGLIFGSVITIGMLLIFSFLTKTINYVFTYYLADSDYFFLVDEGMDYKDELVKLLTSLSSSEHLVICESNNKKSKNIDFVNILKKSRSTNTFKEIRSILDVSNYKEVQRITYVLEEGITSREWYNKERKLSEPYKIPTSVIQVNKKTK